MDRRSLRIRLAIGFLLVSAAFFGWSVAANPLGRGYLTQWSRSLIHGNAHHDEAAGRSGTLVRRRELSRLEGWLQRNNPGNPETQVTAVATMPHSAVNSITAAILTGGLIKLIANWSLCTIGLLAVIGYRCRRKSGARRQNYLRSVNLLKIVSWAFVAIVSGTLLLGGWNIRSAERMWRNAERERMQAIFAETVSRNANVLLGDGEWNSATLAELHYFGEWPTWPGAED